MEDFFKQFRDNIWQRPEPRFKERDWLDLQKRLDLQERKRRTGFAWLLLWPALFLSLGANALLLTRLKDAGPFKFAVERLPDSTVHTRVVYRTDTVFKTRVLRQWMPQKQAGYPPASTEQPGGDAVENYLFKKFSSNEKSWSKDRIIPIDQQRTETNTEPLPLPEPATLRYRRPAEKLSELPLLPSAGKPVKTLRRLLYDARPRGFQLGIAGGWVYPVGKQLDFQSGYSAGLEAALEFSPKVQLWLDAAYINPGFTTTRMGDDIGVPVASPPSDDYIFRKAEVPQPALQYSVGLQYLLNTKWKLQPCVGLGFGAVAALPYDIIYEFVNPALGVEWNLDWTMREKPPLARFLLFRAGVEYPFSRHWLGKIQLGYRRQLGGTSARSPNMPVIQGGLNYHF